MTLTHYKRAMLARPDALGVLQVFGWQVVREECGCTVWEGMRLDKMEPTFAIDSCPDHAEANRFVLDTLKTMPPSPEPVVELWERLLEGVIAS